MTKKEIDVYIQQLKTDSISRSDIPRDIITNDEFISAERLAKIRTFGRRGYDIIKNDFFVYESILNSDKLDIFRFETFEEYYTFLNGDIYDNASYYQYTFEEKDITKFNLDTGKLSATHFIDSKLEDYNIIKALSADMDSNNEDYKEKEKQKKQLLKWLDKFCTCDSVYQYEETMGNFHKSVCYSYITEKILVNLLIKKNPELVFEVYINDYHRHLWLSALYPLLGHYDIDKIINAVHFNSKEYIGSKASFYKHKKKFNVLISNIKNEIPCKVAVRKGFDQNTNFYFVNVTNYYKHNGFFYDDEVIIYNYFFTFEEFANYLNNDLSDCNLSKAKISNIDFEKYITNNNTVLPEPELDVNSIDPSAFNYEIHKIYEDGLFRITENWSGHGITKTKSHYFDYFGDFVYYLSGDLSNADLTLCNTLVNLKNITGIDFTNAKLQSDFCEKFGLYYDKLPSPQIEDYSFDITERNEEETALILQNNTELTIPAEERFDYKKISYISDLHLMHLFRNRNCKSKTDSSLVLQEVTKSITQFGDYLLIGGDVASDFSVFEQFICYLKDASINSNIIFVLGNHELWSFPEQNFNDISDKYKQVIEDAGFYLLQNSLLYETIDRSHKEIDEKTLLNISVEELKEKLKDARLIFFGGLAFSGLNEAFNANNDIYKGVISRQQEIEESKKFESLYNKICVAAKDKNTIIFTHTRKDDWTHNRYVNGFVYVNGHTHKNYFYDDGEKRIYADNQVGYHVKKPFLKHFYIDKAYDYFADYKDGIYEITKEQYEIFNRAKNIMITFNRKGIIYMLKRDDYYCFFLKSKNKILMLNGGALKTMNCNDLDYYYSHMTDVINIIKEPINKFYAIQNKIADQIRQLGGDGTIHGTIIDIDFYNHIYVNPYDNTITGYFAYDMVNKYVYKNIPSLLKDKCPQLFGNYVKQIEGKSDNALVVHANTEIDTTPKYYPETDIYKASRIIKKMQKVNKGILSTWIEPTSRTGLFIEMKQ